MPSCPLVRGASMGLLAVYSPDRLARQARHSESGEGRAETVLSRRPDLLVLSG